MKYLFRKGIALILSVSMLLSGTACSAKPADNSGSSSSNDENTLKFTSGTYEGEAEGFHGNIKLKVTVDETSIKSVEIIEHNETNGIGTVALEKLPVEIVEKQSIGLDALSGCTFSSNGVLNAVENALKSSGVNLEALKLKHEVEESEDSEAAQIIETDLLVVGAGAAGLTAAIEAKATGKNVIVLEKMPFTGGATSTAGGGTIVCDATRQREAGIEDSPELYFMDMMRGGHFKANPELAWLLANNSGRMLDWLIDDIGVEYAQKPAFNAEQSVDRVFSATGGAATLINTLEVHAESKGVEIHLNTEAIELTKDGEKINGVLAKNEDGKTVQYKADAVLLATGGFGANPELMDEELKKVMYYGPSCATGDGLQMALEVGAVAENMEYGAIHPNGIEVAPNFGRHTQPECNVTFPNSGAIWVGKDGNRVVNELGLEHDVIAAHNAQEDGCLYLVMDQTAFDLYHDRAVGRKGITQDEFDKWFADNGANEPVFIKNDTLEGACEIVGIDADQLKNSIERFNGFVTSGNDEDFGRPVANAKTFDLENGPYYIVKNKLRVATTLGGIKINSDMQVIDKMGNPIEGLYAAGEIVSVHGTFNTMGGISWALTSGMVAGETIGEDK